MATHSSILAREIPWTDEPCGLQSLELQSQTELRAHTHTYTCLKLLRCLHIHVSVGLIFNNLFN